MPSLPTSTRWRAAAQIERDALRAIVVDLHWMARRYADGRMSYAPALFNDHTRALLALGIVLNPTADGTVWARDGQGRDFDALTDAEATPNTPDARGESAHGAMA